METAKENLCCTLSSHAKRFSLYRKVNVDIHSMLACMEV